MLDKIMQKIKDKGGRMTIQRQAILELLAGMDHPTAEEIFQYTHDRFPSLSFTTVYNTLKSFKELDVVREYYMEDRSRFELAENSHPHLHCVSCGRLMNINPEKIKIEIDPTLEKELSLREIDLIIHGICLSCGRNKDKS